MVKTNMKYRAKVKWNGGHYFSGDNVAGSKIMKRLDGTLWLFDDEPIELFPYYGEASNEWVEIDEKTLEEEK